MINSMLYTVINPVYPMLNREKINFEKIHCE